MSKKLANISGSLFKINDEPAQLTPGQKDIFNVIVKRPSNRVHIMACTQYGKSLIVALACLVASCIQGRMVVVLAPSNEKAKIIMRYYTWHLQDDPAFYGQLEKDTKLDRLILEESKERIILKNGGGIYVVSLQTNNPKRSIQAAMGEGADIVILDEAALISDEAEATVFRMIAGKKNGFYCKIGNPFTTGHFYRDYLDPNYKKINIDYHQAIEEGRYNAEFIEEAKKRPFFDILFGNQFPEEDLVDSRGWYRLLTKKDIEQAITNEFTKVSRYALGVDIARGGANESVYTIRDNNTAKVVERNRVGDLMHQVVKVQEIMKQYDIHQDYVYIDDVGVGGGVTDRLAELGIQVNKVKEGASAKDKDKFANLKAENYWLLREWIKNGGKLFEDKGWLELTECRFKEDSASRLRMEPKDEMLKRGIQSPDTADSLMLTFSNYRPFEGGLLGKSIDIDDEEEDWLLNSN